MSDLTISVGFLITVCLFCFTAINFFSSRKSSSNKDVENKVKINMKLDEICRTTNETRSDIKGMKNEISQVQEEQIRQKLQIETLRSDVDELKGKM